MRKSLRAFGMGLFIAGATLSILSFFNDSSLNEADSKQVEQLEKELEHAKKELSSIKNEKKDQETTSANKETNSTEQAEQTQDDETDNTSSGEIYIYNGVSLYDIGRQAEDLGIVENGRELELYLSKPEYSRSIQKGQFELDSSMSLKEMAEILTGKNL